MKETVVIDLKNTYLQKGSKPKRFEEMLEGFFADLEREFQLKRSHQFELLEVFKRLEEKNSSSLKDFLAEIFPSEDKGEIFEKMEDYCVRNVVNWANLKKSNHLWFVDKSFDISDLQYLNVNFNVIYLYVTKNEIKRNILKLWFNLFNSNKFLFFVKKNEKENVINLIDLKKSFVVTSRPGYFINHILNNNTSIKDMDIQNRVLYFKYNTLPLPYTQSNDKEACVLGLKWDIFSLKLLYGRILTIKYVLDKKVTDAEIIRVGFDFDAKATYECLDLNILNDSFPLIFVYWDIFSDFKSQRISCLYNKITTPLSYHNWNKPNQIKDKLVEATDILSKIEQEGKSKIRIINNISDFYLFLSRVDVIEWLDKFLKGPQIQKEMATHKDYTIQTPKTLIFNQEESLDQVN